MSQKAKIETDIGEMLALIDYHWNTFKGIPENRYTELTVAGHTLKVTALNHKRRAIELRNTMNETWPK